MIRRIFTALAVSAALFAALAVPDPGPARAATSPGGAALNWAEAHATGHLYTWGGTGPYGFDCSGLVWAAFRAEGITLPRTTYAMPGSWHLYRVWNPRRGDLAFWGPVGSPYHVEMVTVWYHATFGALNSGTLVGWHTYYPPRWSPSAFYRVR